MRCCGEEVAVVGPDLRLAQIECGSDVDGIASTKRNCRWQPTNQGCCGRQQCICDGPQIPDICSGMCPEEFHQFTSLRRGE